MLHVQCGQLQNWYLHRESPAGINTVRVTVCMYLNDLINACGAKVRTRSGGIFGKRDIHIRHSMLIEPRECATLLQYAKARMAFTVRGPGAVRQKHFGDSNVPRRHF